MPSLGHLYGEPYQALRRSRGPRDAAYHEKFRNPDRYTLAWSGPELAGSGGDCQALAPFIQIERFDLHACDIQTFNIWFVTAYPPMLAQQSDAVRVRRYLSMEGGVSHVVLHEATDATPLEDDGVGDLGVLPTQHQSGRYRRVITS